MAHHELALSTSEYTHRKEKYTAHRPRGSCIVHCSTSQKRRKWLEIVCDFAHPRRRHEFDNLKNPIPNWDIIKQFWTQKIYDAWRSADSPTDSYPNGQLIADRACPQTLWDAEIKSRGLEGDMGSDPRSDVLVTDTWLFSQEERKRYFIVVSDSDDNIESDKFSERIQATDAVVGSIFYNSTIIDYRADMDLTEKALSDISDPTIEVNPKFNAAVSIDSIKKDFDINKARADIIAKYPEAL